MHFGYSPPRQVSAVLRDDRLKGAYKSQPTVRHECSPDLPPRGEKNYTGPQTVKHLFSTWGTDMTFVTCTESEFEAQGFKTDVT